MDKKQQEVVNGGSKSPRSDILDRQQTYFLSLTVQNIRCFGDQPQTLDLSDGNGCPARWTILLGNNGTGKTTLLQALVSIEPFRRLLPSERLDSNTVYLVMPRIVGGWIEPPSFPPLFRGDRSAHNAFISMQVWNGGCLNSPSRSDEIEIGYSAVYSRGTSNPHWRSYMEFAPVCTAYGASRRMAVASLSEESSADAVASLASESALLRNAEEWLLQLDYAASTESKFQKKQAKRLEQVRELLISVLPDISNIRRTTPASESDRPRFEFETPFGWVYLNQLSNGYQTMIAWIVDFASRMVERYPKSKNPLAEPAVCLVDEIDLHLHPHWQRSLMGYLTERFPNTQFIVTAHSPLIVQAASGVNANLALLRREGDHVVIDNDVDAIRGWRVDQILTSELFDLKTSRPPDFEKDILRRQELLAKDKPTKRDLREIAKLESKIGPLPVGDTADESRRILDLVDQTHRLLNQDRGNNRDPHPKAN